ncbi:hypothetical protein [Streptococcus pyogenes]|uniref:hypothetical protein n=1 Tax=Streptococcus pyogenes TaxID=1314 RepID=UPI0007C29367|nr:hypothetical protein [Streptococcus pyogenes]OAC54453.1 hypothetical protein AWT85_01205 [Streptococcus pyogenes]OAC58667.1 hypothetical protein AWU03_07900 [Streptococcus pyogenes]OAC61862.1 hypothetical protein AWU04_00870 [Streptococcus pyogenes]OAC67946.1 hypothetical protein AWT96_03000 [Streptococcus pyogenes]OAC72663.1 hypothetical protein AWT88_01205 [Streptococcus pyogenes]
MIPKVIIDDFDTSTIPNCVLTGYDVGDILSPSFVENEVYGMNGTNRELESYNESKPTLSWHLNSFDDAVNLVNRLDGLSKKIEFWHIPNSFYYYDCLSVKINAVNMKSWRVTLKLALYPFRYAKGISDVTITGNGNINNTGNVFSEPKIVVEGTGKGTLTIGKQVMELNLSGKATIECKHGQQCVYDTGGNVKNSIRIRGSFFEIQPGTQGIAVSGGITRLTISPRWRYKV